MNNLKFRYGLPTQSRRAFTEASLPDAEKEQLCCELLAEFGAQNVTKRGHELIHSCCLPFNGHKNGDKNPSARFNFHKLTYICNGCGNSGGLLWFIGVCRGTSSTQARTWLGQQVKHGLDGTSDGLAALLRYFDELAQPGAEPPPLPNMDPRILEPWHLIHPYLTEMRRIPEPNLIEFEVGFDPAANRIVVPHYWRGRLVGWQTRRIMDDGSPRWKMSPDFPKAETIFNFHPQRDAVVVEAALSVVAKAHVLLNIEATFGATVTEKQVRLLGEHTRVTLFFDNDRAGWKATREVGKALLPMVAGGVWVADNPWDADPADLDDDACLRAVERAIPFAVWTEPRQLERWVA